MAEKSKLGRWSMQRERELIKLARTESLEAIARHFQRPPANILKRAAKLGLSIRRPKAKK